MCSSPILGDQEPAYDLNGAISEEGTEIKTYWTK